MIRRTAGLATGLAVLAPVLAAGPRPLPAQETPGEEAPARAAAAQAGPIRLGLDDAVARAVRENEQVLIARAERDRTEGIVTEVRSRSLPDLSTDFAYNRNIQSPVIFFNTESGVQQIRIGSANEYSFGLSLSQTLFDPSLGPARAAARLTREATATQVEAARTDVARQARVAYFTALLDRELLRVQEQALAQAETRLGQVESFYQAGTASEFDLLTARVEVENIRPDVIDARNTLELDRERLKRVVGVPLDRELALTDSLRTPGELPLPDSAVERALARRADLQSQVTRVALQQENLTSEKNSALPSLDLTASLSRRASSEELAPGAGDFSQSFAAGLAFSLPLFDGRARAGRVQQAEAAVERERFRLERMRNEVRLQVTEARQSLEASRERIEASRSNVERAERALEIAQTRFRNGLSTQVELNDAELAVTRARTNYAQSLYAYNVAWANLRAATGAR